MTTDSETRKVLVVEDDKLIRDLVLAKLKLSGFEPYECGDGAEAIDVMTEVAPDVLILDLMLPGKTGEEILAEMKQNDTLKTLPVIVFSNKSTAADKKTVMDLGADRYHVKALANLNDLISDIEVLAEA